MSASGGFSEAGLFIATLIAVDRLGRGDISAAADALRHAGIEPSAPRWLDEGSACDLTFTGEAPAARSALDGRFEGIDVVVQPGEGRARRLLAADMDSTMITVECIDELADYAGVKAEVAAVTEQAMRGELDFEGALDARVALLRGLDETIIDRCRKERVRLMPGARTLVQTMRAHGAFCLLVSGGFTRFAEPVAEAIGFDAVAANRLDIERGRLTGTVGKPIVGAEGKRQAMLEAAARNGVDPDEILAVGDGANDIPMLKAAGLGVAYHAKPAVAAVADARIAANDLTALLYIQGYKRNVWVD
jgi:phosphoserine phosphatase